MKHEKILCNKCLLHSIHSYYVSFNIRCESLYDIERIKTKANIEIFIYRSISSCKDWL